jgi:hypothetical protein
LLEYRAIMPKVNEQLCAFLMPPESSLSGPGSDAPTGCRTMRFISFHTVEKRAMK